MIHDSTGKRSTPLIPCLTNSVNGLYGGDLSPSRSDGPQEFLPKGLMSCCLNLESRLHPKVVNFPRLCSTLPQSVASFHMSHRLVLPPLRPLVVRVRTGLLLHRRVGFSSSLQNNRHYSVNTDTRSGLVFRRTLGVAQTTNQTSFRCGTKFYKIK